LVVEETEQLLLWRPRYAEVPSIPIQTTSDIPSLPSVSYIQEFVEREMESRNSRIDASSELREELQDRQPLHRSTMSLILPRSPSSLREQEAINRRKREADSWLKAKSLLMNLKLTDQPSYVEIGERIFVNTVVLYYQSLSFDNERITVLENPLSNSLEDAEVSGRALTRLAFLNKQCFKLLLDRAF
jgi:hypothetical protein